MKTRQVKGALKAMPVKTDRRDAEGIARLLHLGWFRPVHCKSVPAPEVRAVPGARKAIQQGMIARTPRGRVAMPAAYTHIGLAVPSAERHPGLFD